MKSLLCILALAGTSFMNLSAQVQTDSTTHATDPALQEQQRNDSLTQVVQKLEERVNDTQKQQHFDRVWQRSKYRNIAFVKQSLQEEGGTGEKWNSDFAFALTMGRTYYLHRKPILNMIKLGIDWTYMDLNYANYGKISEYALEGGDNSSNIPNPEYPYEEKDEDLNIGRHQFEYSMHVGPSITINPIDHLKVNAYFRYAPTFSGILIDDDFSCNYASFFVSGASISYKLISFGIEGRWGKAKYNNFSMNEFTEEDLDVENPNLGDMVSKSKRKFKTNSVRFYISFRI